MATKQKTFKLTLADGGKYKKRQIKADHYEHTDEGVVFVDSDGNVVEKFGPDLRGVEVSD